MWYILRSDPGVSIGIGLRRTITPRRLRNAGEIEQLIDWVPVLPGDVVFVPAGTIHAIGPGLAPCEIQQLSDTTYRLYDYGRPRELHLDRGVAVSNPRPYRRRMKLRPIEGGTRLVSCPYFNTDQLSVDGNFCMRPANSARTSSSACAAGAASATTGTRRARRG